MRPPARPVRHDARRDARRDDLDAYVKKIVDSLPPLTDEQRDLLAMIFRSRHRRKLPAPAHEAPRRPSMVGGALGVWPGAPGVSLGHADLCVRFERAGTGTAGEADIDIGVAVRG
jgi:hypothetical protein